jgi:putative SOS response-associated peptidase YedK
MCGRVIQSSAPIRYAIVDGINVRDSRVHNYPPRWNAAPSHDLLVIRRNHKTGEVSLVRCAGASSRIGARTRRVAENQSTRNARPSAHFPRSGRLIVSGGASCRLTASSSGKRSNRCAPSRSSRRMRTSWSPRFTTVCPDPRTRRLRPAAVRRLDPGDLMRPFPAEPMWMWPISTHVNKPENDDQSIVEPIEVSAATA